MSTHDDTEVVDALAAVLQEHYVFAGSPEKRTAMARDLATHGVLPSDVELIADWTKRKSDTEDYGALLAWWLQDHQRWHQLLEDLQAGKRKHTRGRSGAEPGVRDRSRWTPDHDPGTHAYYRFTYEGASLVTIAAEMGTSQDHIRKMIDAVIEKRG